MYILYVLLRFKVLTCSDYYRLVLVFYTYIELRCTLSG